MLAGAWARACSLSPLTIATMDLEAYLRQIKLNRFIPAPPAERMFVGGTLDEYR